MSTAVTDLRDHVAGLYPLADFAKQCLIVTVQRVVVVAMIDDDQMPIMRHPAGPGDAPIRDRADISACRRADQDAPRARLAIASLADVVSRADDPIWRMIGLAFSGACVLAALAIVFAGLSRVASRLLAPALPTVAKSSPYECGIEPTQETTERFPVRFYLVAMIFIVFDIEIIFLYPYAVIHRELGVFGMVEMVIFAVAVFASFLYLIANGALDWGPMAEKRRAIRDEIPALLRAGTGSVRRVGGEGRELPPERGAAA